VRQQSRWFHLERDTLRFKTACRATTGCGLSDRFLTLRADIVLIGRAGSYSKSSFYSAKPPADMQHSTADSPFIFDEFSQTKTERYHSGIRIDTATKLSESVLGRPASASPKMGMRRFRIRRGSKFYRASLESISIANGLLHDCL
jgi:hypothetical protein